MQKQPLEVQTLYAELLERLTALEAHRTIGHARGSFVTKTIKGEVYYYFQYLEPGGAKRQLYIGRKDDVLDGVVEEYFKARADVADDRKSIERLCALLRVGGALTTDAASARVLRALSEAGLFHAGAVLVGTQAFTVIGNLLGVVWRETWLRTLDIDIVADTSLSVAAASLSADVPDTLSSLKMGFLPVPGFDLHLPSTSFKVRGQALRVDLLVPSSGRDASPVPLPRFNAAAQPLPYLDYVTEAAVRGAVVDQGGVLVNVPDPARFAFHKLIVASLRPAAMHVKRDKDLRQAAQVFSVLLEERPGDVGLAWEAILGRGRGWVKRVGEGLRAMAAFAPDVAVRLSAETTQ